MTGRIRSLATDRRARIPFAVIGLLLLVSSGMFAVQLEQRDDPAPALEADRAMEQTEAAARTALSQALTDATELAATRPLTATADTPYGKALTNGTGDPFDRYLEALVYLQATEKLDTAGQRVGDIETSVSVAAITDPEGFRSALERVTVRSGTDTPGIEPGVLEAEIEGVTTRVTRNGREIDRETETVTVATATPLYQLHDRTATFQDRLEAGITRPGFSQRFNAYIYALGWARGYAQYMGAPVTEVIANRHVVPAANDAVYRTQMDVFGSPDPELNNAVRRGWLCMAMHDAEGLYDGLTGRETNYAADLCDASELLLGDQATGDLPESPGPMDLLGKAPGTDAEQTIGVNQTAYLPYREMVVGSGEHSLDAVIDRIFEIETATEHSTRTVRDPSFTHDPPRPYRFGHGRVVETENERTAVELQDISRAKGPDEYYEIEGTVRLRLNQTKHHSYRDADGRHETTTSARGTRTVAFELTIGEGNVSPDAAIDEYNRVGGDQLGINGKYRSGSTDYPPSVTDRTAVSGPSAPASGVHFDDVEPAVLAAYFGDEEVESGEVSPPGPAEIETALEESWSGARTAEDLAFPGPKTVSLDPSARLPLERSLARDIRRLRRNASRITHRFERRDVVHDGSGTGPYGELRQEVGREKRAYLQREKPYASVGQKALYEARYAYFELLEADLERIERAHATAMNRLDTELSDVGLGEAISYLQEGMTASPPEPVPLESSSLTNTVSYEVSGSPTYLVAENVTTREVPAVRNDVDAFAPLAVRTRNHFQAPYETIAGGILGSVAERVGLGSPDAELTLGTASEALRAGEFATTAAGNSRYGDETALDQYTGQLESNVAKAISSFETEAARQVAFQLYPEDVVGFCAQSGCSRRHPTEIDSNPSEMKRCKGDGCNSDVDISRACTGGLCALEKGSPGKEALSRIRRAVERVVRESNDSTAATARAVDRGELTGPIADAVFGELNDSTDRPGYAERMADEQWRAVVESATRPAVRSAASEQSVTISDSDLIENLDSEIRRTLGNVSADVLSDRVADRVAGRRPDIGRYEDWVGGTETPLRVPAGMPLLPLPNLWFATANVWDIEIEGEYARFEVSANVGAPEATGTMTYVREETPVAIDIAGESRRVGSVDPISFSGRSILVVVVPPGGIGVGDRDEETTECSPTWPATGDVTGEKIRCGGTPWR